MEYNVITFHKLALIQHMQIKLNKKLKEKMIYRTLTCKQSCYNKKGKALILQPLEGTT